jgi:hypothetical protein
VLTPQEFEPPQVAKAEAILRQRVDPSIDLIVRSLISRDADRNGPVFLVAEAREHRAQAAEQMRFLNQATQIVNAHLASVSGARLIDLQRESDGGTLITAVVRTPTAISPSLVAAMEKALRGALATPARLLVRSIPIQVANSQGFLYSPKPTSSKSRPAAPDGVTPALRQRLEGALNNQLRLRARGTSLIQMRATRQEGRLGVLAVVRGPRLLRSSQVRQMEARLRRYVEPELDLVVRCTLGAEVTHAGRR